MSYSAKVREELTRKPPSARHCRIAELAALISCLGQVAVYTDPDGEISYNLMLATENLYAAKTADFLIRKISDHGAQCMVRGAGRGRLYLLDMKDREISKKLLMAAKLIEDDGNIRENLVIDDVVTVNSCCKRAYVRGLFLAAGSVTDPSKGYHLEINTGSEEKAKQLIRMLQSFDIKARTVVRKGSEIVYLKESESICDFLNLIGAHVAMMEFENVRILKDMRNSINRQVNCETANIGKTVSAAARQVEDIMLIRDTIGFGSLDEGLLQVAMLRLENEDMPLKDLGLLLDPPLGKSGVNHRLRRLSAIAEKIRDNSKEDV